VIFRPSKNVAALTKKKKNTKKNRSFRTALKFEKQVGIFIELISSLSAFLIKAN